VRRRRNPSRQASGQLIDGSTGLAFAGGMILGAKGMPPWLALLIIGSAEVGLQMMHRNYPGLWDVTPNSPQKALVDAGAGMIGWWAMAG
jgi:hypothetical protein